jgi:type II secretory pathway pseudopilin PulG
MNTRAAIMSLKPRNGARTDCHREAGFTMAEIAIALGVIAFALIAIIGILPAGLQVQKDNREETIINQDARLLLEAIKSGGRDVTSDLGLFVVGIDSDGTDYGAKSPPGIPTTNLVQLLSDTNSHTIIFSAISGGVASRGSDLGFRYQVINHVLNPTGGALPQGRLFGGADEFRFSELTNQIYDVRLRFAWPIRADGKLGPEANRYVARALIAGWHTNGVMYGQQYYNPEP